MSDTKDPGRAHARAIHALVEHALACPVYFGGVTPGPADLTYPYVVVWASPASRGAANLTSSVSQLDTTTLITAVGEAPDDVLAQLDRVADALQGVRPTLPNRSAGLILNVPGSTPIDEDDTTRTAAGRPVWRGVAQYALTSFPAPAAA